MGEIEKREDDWQKDKDWARDYDRAEKAEAQVQALLTAIREHREAPSLDMLADKRLYEAAKRVEKS